MKLIHTALDPQQGALVKQYEPENMQLAIDRDRLRELGLDLDSVKELLEAQPYVFAAFTEDELAHASSRLAR